MSDVLERAKKYPDDYSRWASELIAEIERLQAIVGKLPKTADGVPVALQMKVYFHYRSGGVEHICERTVSKIEIDAEQTSGAWLDWHWHWQEKTADRPSGRYAEDCYSTREAAEAQERREMINRQQHALALLENGWTVRDTGGKIEWRSPRGISGDQYESLSLDDPPGAAVDDALAHGDYYATEAEQG